MKTDFYRSLLGLCLALSLLVLLPASRVRAATIPVTNCNDSGPGSLRQAVELAGSGDAVAFNLDCPAGSPLALGSPISIEKNLSISGEGRQVVISGNNAVRILLLNYDTTISLEYLTLKNGLNNDGGNGGAIYDNGSFLTISHVSFEENHASGDDNRDGGAIFHQTHGSLVISDSSFTNNSATRHGGAIVSKVDMTITDSTFTGNSATRGGAIAAWYGSALSLERVTMSGNTAIGPGTTSGQGGAIYFISGALNIHNSTLSGNGSADSTNLGGAVFISDSTVTLRNSTIVNNLISTAQPDFTGGGIQIENASLSYTNTILANNTGGDCVTGNPANLKVLQNTRNLVEVSTGCGTPYTTSDPKLGALANNGGKTSTHALLSGSPALNAGNDATCLATDQRGFPRPFGSHCDIGAYERTLFSLFLPLTVR